MTKAGFKTIGLTALLTLSLIHQAVAGSWIKAETTHFIIYSDNDEKSTRDYASRLEAFNTIATNFYRRLSDSEVSDTTKPVFYFFDDLSIFKAVRPKLTNGFIISLSCRDGAANFWSNNKDINSDATQEYQFQSLNTLVASRYSSGMPDWLSRGLNLYLLTADIKNDTVQLGAASPYQFSYQTDYVSDHRQSLMAKNDRIPYAEILSGKPSNLKKTGSIPGQSWIITHYMLTDPQNQAKLFTYIDLYNHGATSLEAWKKAVGLDPSFFDDLTVNYMAKGVPIVTYKFLPLAGDAVAITKLAAYNDSVPMLSAALNTCPDKNYQSEIEARLEKVAAVMPDDTFVQREAARAQVWYSDKPETALPYLQKQITENPKDYDAHYMLGRLLLRQAQYAKARVELGTAYQLNPSYAPILYFYAKSFADKPDYPSDNTLAAMETALDLANNPDNRYYLAELYVRKNLYEDATEMLKCFVDPKGKTISAVVTQKIMDAMAAHKPNAEIIPMFSEYTDHPEDFYKKSS